MSRNKYLPILVFSVGLILSSCGTNSAKSDQAQLALQEFFARLAQGDYQAAPDLFAGSYDALITFNPQLDPDDYPSLWQYGCQMNGLMCLTVRTATLKEATDSGTYLFTVEFNNPDESLFILEPCCGEDPSTASIAQFEYRVEESPDGQFRVLDIPVYMP
jgi:hypothetical protein